MKITILVEGRTEDAFRPHLIEFLKVRLAGAMPRLDFYRRDGRIRRGTNSSGSWPGSCKPPTPSSPLPTSTPTGDFAVGTTFPGSNLSVFIYS